MKSFQSVAIFLGCLFFISCQKELSFETGTVPPNSNGSTVSVYALGGAGSTCAGATLTGTYMNGMDMTAANTATIQVTVTTPGTYNISTASVNGVSFRATGSFTSTGTQTVTLAASGTPTSAGAKTFPITGSGTCSFDITFAAAAPPAVFTWSGNPSACALPAINGTYSVNTPLSSANTVILKVNVTTAGSYNIVTDIVNGISFSASGVFTTTGTDVPVTLVATGTPLAAGTTTLKPGGASTCSFSIPVTAAPIATGIYSCKIDGVATTFTELAAAGTTEALTNNPNLSTDGYKDSNHDSNFQIFISNNDLTAVRAGTYDEKHYVPTSPTALGYRIEVDYSVKNADLSTTIWNTSSNIPTFPANPAFTIVVTSITATRVKGTFSGKLTNTLQGSTAFKTITEGVFDLPIQ